MNTKPWYKSWTIWANLLALVVLVASNFGFSDFKPDPAVNEIGTIIIIAINLALRYWRTRQPIAK